MEAEIKAIFDSIARLKRECGITRDITVTAATKTIEPERINLLPAYGITIAGENRVQELVAKYDEVRGVEWHFIGALQTNKVKYILGKVTLVHSLDRPALADEIERLSERRNEVTNVLVEVNTGREPSKSGVLPENAEALMEYAAGKKHIKLCGVMGVFPVGADERLYDELYTLGEKCERRYGGGIISAGMSNDYLTAIRHGANMVRLGSAIFGPRQYKENH